MKKPAIIMISMAAAFLLIIVGFFIGRISKDGTMTIQTQKSNRSESIKDETRPHGLININTANADELQNLPGIGPATAELIIKYRNDNGPFKYKSDLMYVNGIGEKTYDEIKSMITINDNS